MKNYNSPENIALVLFFLLSTTYLSASKTIQYAGWKVFLIDDLECCVNLRRMTYYLQDDGSFSIADITSGSVDSLFNLDADLLPTDKPMTDYWVRASFLYVPKGATQPWIIAFGGDVHKIDWYAPGVEGIQTLTTGSLVPIYERPHVPPAPLNFNAFSFNIPVDTLSTYYFRLSSVQPGVLPALSLYNETGYTPLILKEAKRIMLFSGSIGILWLYASILFLIIRERVYLYYLVFLSGILLYVWYSSGYLFREMEYLFPDNPGFKYFAGMSFYVAIIAYLAFIQAFLDLKTLLPLWDRIFKLFIWTGLGLLACSCIFLYLSHFNVAVPYKIFIIYALLSFLISMLFFVPLAKQAVANKKFIILGGLPLILGSIPGIVHLASGHYSKSDLFLFELGVIGQAVVFSWGLAYRQYKHQQAGKEAQRLKEVNQVKDRLFTNITHEFRTPLTIILGTADLLKKQMNANASESIQLIKQNGLLLLRFINQLLDLTRLETGHLKLVKQQGDIVAYLKYLLESFHSYAGKKAIQLRLHTDLPEFFMDYDADRLMHIISNLLSNAIKFSKTGQDVDVFLSAIDGRSSAVQQLQIQVKDRGIGIHKKALPFIFDRFYQAEEPLFSPVGNEGTGIGLALTRELVKLMGGEIWVESKLGKGSTFTVTLPVTRKQKRQLHTPAPVALARTSAPARLPRKQKTDQARMLIVEDNEDLILFLQKIFHRAYQVEIATDGRQGIKMAIAHTPDIIITDVMMPLLDGFELCATLKNHELTSHIPIIMLTARADAASRIDGLKRGADAYLPKPFLEAELHTRIEALLAQRKKLQAFYRSQAGLSSQTTGDIRPLLEEMEVESRFLEKVNQKIRENLDNPAFGVNELSKALFVDASNLFRKIKMLTGLNTLQYIRSYRLAKAKQLLEETELSILVISLETGFSDQRYFSRIFKREVGMTPTAYRAACG